MELTPTFAIPTGLNDTLFKFRVKLLRMKQPYIKIKDKDIHTFFPLRLLQEKLEVVLYKQIKITNKINMSKILLLKISVMLVN